MPDINWYPGHMAKSRRLLLDQLKSVDAVIELCDARAPISTRNPDLMNLAQGKAHVLVLGKCDLASESATQAWLSAFKRQNIEAIRFDVGGRTREITDKIAQITRPVVERMKARGVQKTVRLMVIGIPNVGKSTFINRLNGSAVAKTADRPGVTRANQWVKVGPYLELLDTPGMLWPKLNDQRMARTLAYLGSIRDQIMDGEELAMLLMQQLIKVAPDVLRARYKLDGATSETPPNELLQMACKGRGWLMAGARYDTERAAAVVLDEFRAGKIGRITLEMPRETETGASRGAQADTLRET
ncbi:MAG: ribosome biogenesis GTPase YlqF [Clostridia bacterium]